MTLIPAYGRDYKSKAAVQADMDAGKDFVVADFFHPADGKMANREDLLREGITAVMVRYKGKTLVTKVKVR